MLPRYGERRYIFCLLRCASHAIIDFQRRYFILMLLMPLLLRFRRCRQR